MAVRETPAAIELAVARISFWQIVFPTPHPARRDSCDRESWGGLIWPGGSSTAKGATAGELAR